jgi:hypothetical protein
VSARRSALRIAEALVEAKRGGYYVHGWYSYLDRRDVEALVVEALEPTEAGVYLSELRKAAR